MSSIPQRPNTQPDYADNTAMMNHKQENYEYYHHYNNPPQYSNQNNTYHQSDSLSSISSASSVNYQNIAEPQVTSNLQYSDVIKHEKLFLNQQKDESNPTKLNPEALQDRLILKKKLQRNRTSFSQQQIEILESGESYSNSRCLSKIN